MCLYCTCRNEINKATYLGDRLNENDVYILKLGSDFFGLVEKTELSNKADDNIYYFYSNTTPHRYKLLSRIYYCPVCGKQLKY